MDLPAVLSPLKGFPESPVTTETATIEFSAGTSTPADGVTFSQDGGDIGTATGGPTAWSFDWDISGLVDGDYVIGARAHDDQGEYGAPTTVTYSLNRFVPMPPENFVAGVNGTRVDAEWSANPERDIVGYHVYKQGPSGSAVRVNCGTAEAPVYLLQKRTTCTDADPLAAGVSWRDSSIGSDAGSTLTIARPEGVLVGDALVATIGVIGSGALDIPPGWTLVRDTAVTGTGAVRQVTFVRVAGNGEPDSYQFTGAASELKEGGISAYSGVDPVAPVDVWGEGSGSSGSATAPSVTTRAAGEAVVVASTHRGDSETTLTAPEGTSSRWLVPGGGGANLAADFPQPTAGTTPPRDIACSEGTCSSWVSQTIALRPSQPPAVEYFVRAVDEDPSGQLREGAESTRVNAYAPNTPPTAPTGLSGVVQEDGSTRLDWTGAGTDTDAGDSVAFHRVYRDGVYYDRTSSGSDLTWTDGDRGGVDHDYHLKAVDMHLAESPASATVRR
jgi:hypothetical protein